jgi:hypothetical protein
MIEAELLEELPQGDAGDADAKGGVDEVDQVSAGGVGMLEQESNNGAGVARQEFAIGTAVQAVMSLLDDRFGREALLSRGSRAGDAEQAGDLGDLEATVTVKQKVTEQACGEVVRAKTQAEAEGGLEQGLLLRGQTQRRNLGLLQPPGERFFGLFHETLSGGILSER